MTILFPGRKLTNDRGRTATSNTFRDKVVECVATRVDKRHIVHDYAVSRDNAVYAPPQDEDHWLNDLDWSGWIILQLYSPDFKNDRPTGSWILQSEWQLYLDVRGDRWALLNLPSDIILPQCRANFRLYPLRMIVLAKSS